jgi:hypothetical protein
MAKVDYHFQNKNLWKIDHVDVSKLLMALKWKDQRDGLTMFSQITTVLKAFPIAFLLVYEECIWFS